jgi:hypothetical protein
VTAERDRAWIGVDIGKTHHWVCVVDENGQKLLSLKVLNDEAQILEMITAVGGLAGGRVWAIDILGTPSALLLALLAQLGEQVRYASGRVVAAMSAAYVGEGKTDAKDAYVIAETARIRTDLAVVDTDTDLVRTLGVLTGHRADLVADRVRMINRLRGLLTSVFPALEREFDFASCKGALVLLTGYATPEAIRRMGEARLSRWLRQRRVRGYADLAARAVAAAQSQHTVLAGQDVTANIVAELAGTVLSQHERLKVLDQQIQDTFSQHPQAEVIESMPGFGPSSALRCWSRPATWPRSRPRGISWPPRGWSRSRTTPDAGRETCTSHGATADRYAMRSTSRRRPR